VEIRACYNLCMASENFTVPRKQIIKFCRRWQVIEFSLFGSALREDFAQDSDVDVLVRFAPEAKISLFDMAQMQIELEQLFQRSVDLLEKDALRNPYRKREIMHNAQVIYAR
jgi:uncharacterized protein